MIKNRLPWLMLLIGVGGGYAIGRVIFHAAMAAAKSTPESSFEGFFTATGTVLAAILIAFAFGAAISDPTSSLAPLGCAVVIVVVAGLCASLGALLPNVSSPLADDLVGVTVAAVFVGLIGVFFVLYQAMRIDPETARAAWNERLLRIGVPPPGDPGQPPAVPVADQKPAGGSGKSNDA